MAEPYNESYVVKCPRCGGSFDAVAGEFCSCLVTVRTPSCPHCGGCFCTMPKESFHAFWSAAPPSLWAKRLSRHSSQKGPRQASRAFLDLRRPLVLIADDERDTLSVASGLVRGFGYGVISTEDGQEAFDTAARFKPDLVLADAMMPKLDGRQLSLRIKNTPGMTGVKVVIMTGLFTKEQHKTEALTKFQADAYLRKPVRPGELNTLLVSLLGPPAKP